MQKKFVLGLTSLVVASAVAIGGTLAFMTAKTDPMTNNFKAVGDGITGQIREPAWDGYDFGALTKAGKQPDGLNTNPDYQGTAKLGIDQAAAFTPGMTIEKNPTLKNTSTNNDAFMAIKVTYSDKKAFNKVASFAVNSGWVKYQTNVDGSEIYIYGTTIQPNAPTADNTTLTIVAKNGDTTKTALFNNVKIDSTKTFDDIKGLNLNIAVTGIAVQTTDISTAEAINQLVA